MYELDCEKVNTAVPQIYSIVKFKIKHPHPWYHIFICPRIHLYYPSVSTGSDHGVKAQGDGWVLTVALVEGVNLASLEMTGLSDPYVVFTCNGKTRTSSVQLQTCDPQWHGRAFSCLCHHFFSLIIVCSPILMMLRRYT